MIAILSERKSFDTELFIRRFYKLFEKLSYKVLLKLLGSLHIFVDNQ